MTDVLIRDVLPEDLDLLRSAAAGQGTSLQGYLRDAVHAQASYLRRQAALSRTAERLRGQRHVPAKERRAVLDAVSDAHTERAKELSPRSKP